MDGGVHILPPYMREGDKGTWFKGTANAIYQAAWASPGTR